MPARRARLGLAHALVWMSWGAAAALVAEQPIPPSSFAFGVAVAAVTAAIVMLIPARMRRRIGATALIGSATAIAVCAFSSALVGTLQVALLVPWLAASAAGYARASAAAAVADPTLAPAVRPSPTLLALALGAAAVAGAAALGVPSLAVLVAIAALQLGAVVLLVGATVASTPRREPDPEPSSPPARLLPLLGLAVAGAAALIALRPALSSLGAAESQPAGPAALTLVIGALAGPPLARLVSRLGLARGGALLATLGGAAALVAPIARPGALDLIAAAVLGVALAAAVALTEIARRSGVAIPAKGVAVLLLAGAIGAMIAGLLLSAVPLPDVVLGASIACLVAGLGAWAPAPRERVS